MSKFTFRVLEMNKRDAQTWLRVWAGLHTGAHDDEYRALISPDTPRDYSFFVNMGRWKDNAYAPGKWQANVASVAYRVWMEAAGETPSAPASDGVRDFLSHWSGKQYVNGYRNGLQRQMTFGLSRTTTMLHFLSKGAYPIFDSRVRRAMARLVGQRAPRMAEVDEYLNWYCPRFQELAQCCNAACSRQLDKALFTYGSENRYEFPAANNGAGRA